ncbi:MAG: prolyl-tRNA synthetase associated domain-containing protein [Clostridia bacterium]|nr:prolyl-tRNA synthetase associated domain-containing protein [Clostridia bacterium]
MKQKVYDFLNSQNINFDVKDHEAVYTMEEMQTAGLDKLGTICKNLFIRDQKGKKHFLITADDATHINLKDVGVKLEAGKVSFASAERLEKYLGVTTGCVSPLGILNDAEHAVTVVLDKKLVGIDRLGVHPNDNTSTLFLPFDSLVKAIEAVGNDYIIVDFES